MTPAVVDDRNPTVSGPAGDNADLPSTPTVVIPAVPAVVPVIAPPPTAGTVAPVAVPASPPPPVPGNLNETPAGPSGGNPPDMDDDEDEAEGPANSTWLGEDDPQNTMDTADFTHLWNPMARRNITVDDLRAIQRKRPDVCRFLRLVDSFPQREAELLDRWLFEGPWYQVPDSLRSDRTFVRFRWEAQYLEGLDRFIRGSLVIPMDAAEDLRSYPYPWQLGDMERKKEHTAWSCAHIFGRAMEFSDYAWIRAPGSDPFKVRGTGTTVICPNRFFPGLPAVIVSSLPPCLLSVGLPPLARLFMDSFHRASGDLRDRLHILMETEWLYFVAAELRRDGDLRCGVVLFGQGLQDRLRRFCTVDRRALAHNGAEVNPYWSSTDPLDFVKVWSMVELAHASPHRKKRDGPTGRTCHYVVYDPAVHRVVTQNRELTIDRGARRGGTRTGTALGSITPAAPPAPTAAATPVATPVTPAPPGPVQGVQVQGAQVPSAYAPLVSPLVQSPVQGPGNAIPRVEDLAIRFRDIDLRNSVLARRFLVHEDVRPAGWTVGEVLTVATSCLGRATQRYEDCERRLNEALRNMERIRGERNRLRAEAASRAGPSAAAGPSEYGVPRYSAHPAEPYSQGQGAGPAGPSRRLGYDRNALPHPPDPYKNIQGYTPSAPGYNANPYASAGPYLPRGSGGQGRGQGNNDDPFYTGRSGGTGHQGPMSPGYQG